MMDAFDKWWHEGASESFDAILFDIDGTLISGGKALPGVKKLLSWLRRRKFPFKLLTNDGNHSLQEKSSFLNKAGLDIAPREIVSCSLALNGLAEDLDLKGRKVFVMGDLGKPSFAVGAGMKPTKDLAEIDSCAAVIVGEGVYDWHSHLSGVLNHLVRNPGGLLVVPNPDSYWPDGKGGFGIGAGAKARFLLSLLSEMGLKREVIYLGKPYRSIFDYAIRELSEDFGLPSRPRRGRILMLGDSLQSDIKGARVSGLKAGLLLTGITNASQIRSAPKGCQPHFTFRRMG